MPRDQHDWMLKAHNDTPVATRGGQPRCSVLVERLVDRMLYVIEQYTCGSTVPISTMDEARYDAMRDACEIQVEKLLALDKAGR